MDRDLHILVVGDLMLDHYIWGSCERISPEAPVQVVKMSEQTYRLGGAGNVVVNLLSLGAKVSVASVLGDDDAGAKIRQLLSEAGANEGLILTQNGRQSSIKTRIIAAHQQVARVDKESSDEIEDADGLLNLIKANLHKFDAVLLSDYAKGVLGRKVCQSVIGWANAQKIPILIDPKGSDYSKYKGATLLTPNKKEASEATGIKITDEASLISALKWLKDEINLKHSIITLSEEGIALFEDEIFKFKAEAKEVFDVTGAGDTVLAMLGFMLASKQDIKEAIKMANLAAAVVVAKVGSATATFSEIEELLRSRASADFEHKIKTLDGLCEILSRRGQKRLVFTNGCFDILHTGHIKYLAKARSFGDILVVGLNSDDSVRRLKGESRPINCEQDRASMLSALGFVDYVVIFTQDTPLELISAIRPDILVKGADYEGKQVVGSELVRDVRLVDFVAGKSTTNIIFRIQNANTDN